MTERGRGDAGKRGKSGGRGRRVADAARKAPAEPVAGTVPAAAPDAEIPAAMERSAESREEFSSAAPSESAPVTDALEASTALPGSAPPGDGTLVVSYAEASEQVPAAPAVPVPPAEALIAPEPLAPAEAAQASTHQVDAAPDDAVQAGASADVPPTALDDAAGTAAAFAESVQAGAEQAGAAMEQGAEAVRPLMESASEAGQAAAASMGEAAEDAARVAARAGAEIARTGTEAVTRTAEAAPPALESARRAAQAGTGLGGAALGGDAVGRAMMSSAAAAARGLFELNGKMVEMVRANNEAALALWQATLVAGSGPEAVRAQAEALRRTYEVTAEHWQDLAQAAARIMGETWQPLQAVRPGPGLGPFRTS